MKASIRIREGATTFLTAAQRALLEQELRSERARVARRMAAGREHPVSVAAGDDETTAALRLVPDDAMRHEAIEEALARLADGSYGRCVVCEAPIAFGRLLVMPDVTTCLDCRGRA